MTPTQIQRIVAVVAVLAALATLGLSIALSDGGGARPWAAVGVIGLLGTMPYAAFLMLGRWAKDVPTAHLVVLGMLVLAAFFAAAIYVQAFVIAPDAQSAIAFVVVPLYQSIGVALAGFATAMLRWRARGPAPPLPSDDSDAPDA